MGSVTMKELKDETRTLDTEKSIFQELNCISVNDHTEEKNGLTYLSWSWAWGELKKRYPNAVYEIERFGEEKKPYLYDENLGYMVFTKMTINDLTHEMWLPVMDGANKAMKNRPYTYNVKKWNNTTRKYDFIDKTVESATMFDINKTIMRCLVKNIGMFGLGLYIYAGEDLPEELKEEQQQEKQQSKPQQPKQQPKQQTKSNLQEEIKKRAVKLHDLGVDFTNQNTIAFIDKYNNGKHDVTKMNDTEKMNYIKVLDQMIKIKEKEGKK